MGTVQIREVRKSYGAVQVLHGISIDIEDGEFVALVGPSGCGKSTLLRMIAGLESISGGDIAIGNRVVNNVAPKDRDIAMVFQNYALYPHKNVRDNMGFALQQRRVPKPEIAKRVNEAARILGLEHLLDRKPRQLSGGQRQRVAMGRAIVRDPNVFLFDEPLSNLDAKLRVQMRSEIKELHQRLKTTTIYVTHDQIEAMTLADRVVVMNGGVVEQEGPPLELYDRPASLFVAAFIGSPPMNFLQGQIIEGNGLRLEDNTVLGLPAADPKQRRQVTIGVRPEHFVIAETGWPATVSIVEPTGSETQITARLAGQLIRILVRGRTSAMPGDEIRLAVTPGDIHFFDAAPIPELASAEDA
ncbi:MULTISPECIES: sn-glycerol-3-phosphate ABC transporter ATP-binding protein UgpC [Rhizobium/Agrobacterium group]|uniref:Sn-glycerol-3-phosphate ABC transporter ATP-binding protein UgpC n=1 Tax=Neorhizobium phenanthreniclasticum TaxID=3157917 RepID=A0ABV0M486_9HYPH|nr:MULTISPECIES: sn-glycerol-3-phosphate ABC transporter ATP-binding protein UgpC [Rhizobium/Agrobacterium group]KGE02426.1 sugar ABC transporter ATP-binding protein [Rhizobium sp. YS-1r]MBP1844008.1 multiple sugar transport system ATP-binding protein [Neorhizobium petrolearium]